MCEHSVFPIFISCFSESKNKQSSSTTFQCYNCYSRHLWYADLCFFCQYTSTYFVIFVLSCPNAKNFRSLLIFVLECSFLYQKNGEISMLQIPTTNIINIIRYYMIGCSSLNLIFLCVFAVCVCVYRLYPASS